MNDSTGRKRLMIDENLYINVVAVGVIIGFSFWLSSVHATGQKNERDLATIKESIDAIQEQTSDKLDAMNVNMTAINRSLGSIEGQLKIISDKKNH